MNIKIKRIYKEQPADEDGYRILVDRIWPRGISKQQAALDEWNKGIAPSDELRKWFDHKAERFDAFSKKYREELNHKKAELNRILDIAVDKSVTLLYGAVDPSFNQAAVLRDVLTDLSIKRTSTPQGPTAKPSSPVCYADSDEIRAEFQDELTVESAGEKKNNRATPTPIKRHEALQPLSREHHQGLLLSWKIRAGLKKGVEVERIWKYCDTFYQFQLLPHFKIEEKHIFPVLGNTHDLVKTAIEQHRQLEELFTNSPYTADTLEQIAAQLNTHIRFEERTLFNALQDSATAEELKDIAKVHPEQSPVCTAIDDWDDEFWSY